MLKTTIKDIEIQYDNSQLSKIDYIKNVIKNNYNLFLSILGSWRIISLISTDREDVVYLSNFDDFFYSISDKIFNDENTKKALSDVEILPAFYIESLVRKDAGNQMSLVQPNPDVDDEMFYSLIAYKYYEANGTFNDFVEYLKKKDNLDTILNWLRTNTRFQAYNYLLETTINFLKENDFDFLEQIGDITDRMLNQTLESIKQKQNKEKIELPQVSMQEFDNLFYQFLQYINAPESWKIMYEELKSSSRLTFENMVDGIDNSMCYKDDNDVLRVLVSTDGTIKSFCSFVHEFSHYVSMQDDVKFSQFSIREFPSIFFENLSAKFLKSKGYSNNVIDRVINDRQENNVSIYMELSSLFTDVLRFVNHGPISKNDKVQFWENQFKSIIEVRKNIAKMCADAGQPITDIDPSFYEMPNIDIESEIDKECDSLIDSFIKNGLSIINGYQYLLDTFLATEVLKKSSTDSTIIPKMIQTTNELSNMNLQSILTTFDLQNIFSQSEISNKSRVKKL